MIRTFAITSAVSLALSGAATAQDPPLSVLDAATLIMKLKPTTEAPTETNDGSVLLGAQPPQELGAFSVDIEELPSVDLAIGFEYNSADLTPTAEEMLAVLAEALSSEELKPYSFQLAGHTDAGGSSGYNERLSMARAVSVKSYLVDTLGVDEARLQAEGYGESRLLLPDAPGDGRNRRVEVTTLN